MAREFQVGEWLVEPNLNRISSAGVTTPVEPKVVEVLVCLANNPGEVLSKDDIIRAVWPDTHVTDEVLTYSISELRKAFHDDARNPRVIQTIPRRGYRLIAPVTPLEPTPKRQPSIAVLAFADMSPEKDQEYFCDGIAEEIISDLAHLTGLRVASRTSAFAFKERSEDVRMIGKKLGVDTVLEGSVRKAGDRLRITAQLINVEDGCHLWSERYERELKDVFAIQDEIARKIVHALEVNLTDTESRRLGRAPTQNVEAYDFYLRGRQFFYRSKRKAIECAIEMFTHATEKDPNYALAYAGLADCYSYMYMYFDSDTLNLERARIISKAALTLDGELAEAHSAHGLAVSLSKQYERAEREFEAAIRLNPRLFEAYYFYARTCFIQGKLDEAVRLFEQAENVKPEDLQACSLMSFALRCLGQKEKSDLVSRRLLKKVERHIELNPDDSRALYLGATALLDLGDREKSLQWARKSYSLDPEDPYIVYGIACFHCMLGKYEEALDYFEKAVRAGFAHREWIETDKDLDPLRSDPRFQAILSDIAGG